MNDADLLNALRDCYDPVLRRNIVDMKLVRSAHLTPDAEAPGMVPRFMAAVSLSAPTSDEGANVQMVAQVENRLLGLEAISRVEVKLLPPLFAIL